MHQDPSVGLCGTQTMTLVVLFRQLQCLSLQSSNCVVKRDTEVVPQITEIITVCLQMSSHQEVRVWSSIISRETSPSLIKLHAYIILITENSLCLFLLKHFYKAEYFLTKSAFTLQKLYPATRNLFNKLNRCFHHTNQSPNLVLG